MFQIFRKSSSTHINMHDKQGLSFMLSIPNDPNLEVFFLKMASCQLETIQNIFLPDVLIVPSVPVPLVTKITFNISICKIQLDGEIFWDPIMYRAMALSAQLQNLLN